MKLYFYFLIFINIFYFFIDIDQIVEDLKPENAGKLEKQPIDPDLPGLGQHYCVSCARYFVDSKALVDHKKTKPHKRRLKALKEEIYTGPAQLIDNGKPIIRQENDN